MAYVFGVKFMVGSVLHPNQAVNGSPFGVLNARVSSSIDSMIRVDTGRESQRAIVNSAILENGHNVLLYGTRGSGKTFFLRTQSHYMKQNDASIMAMFVPANLVDVSDARSTDMIFHEVLSQLFLDLWHRIYGRPRSELLLLSSTSAGTLRKDLSSAQSKIVDMYRLLHATSISRTFRRESTIGASAIAKAEYHSDDSRQLERSGLLSVEIGAILLDFSDLATEAGVTRIVVLLDEVEALVPSNAVQFLNVVFGALNPAGIQVVASVTPGVPNGI